MYRPLSEAIKLANMTSRESRMGPGPLLPEDPTREQLIEWLDWCDPNGCYTDEDNAVEYPDEPPIELETLHELLCHWFESDEPCIAPIPWENQ
jgi:hypothetical protein